MATATRVRSAEAHDFERVTALLESLGRAKVTPETRVHCRGIFERHVAWTRITSWPSGRRVR
jgi:hypothetical protein